MSSLFKRYCCAAALFIFAVICLAAEPSLEVSTQKYATKPGEVFPVTYKVLWEGDPGAYTVLPPVLKEVDWGEASLIEVKSKQRGGLNETCMVVGFRTAEAGVYEAPALDIRLIAWTEENTPAIAMLPPEAAALVLSADPVTVSVKSSGAFLLIITGPLLLFLLLAIVIFLRLRRRVRTQERKQEPSFEEQARALLHEARRNRLDGDYYAFYRTLRRACDFAARASGMTDERLCDLLDRRIKDTGYRGQRPSEDDLEGDFKDVEQWLARSGRRP